MPGVTIVDDARRLAEQAHAGQTRKGSDYYVGEPRIGLLEVEPGKTRDIGDRKLKAQP